MGNPPPSNQATRSSPFNSLEKVNATRRLPSFPTTAQLMEDLANEVRRIIRNLNLGTKIDQLLQEIARQLSSHSKHWQGKNTKEKSS